MDIFPILQEDSLFKESFLELESDGAILFVISFNNLPGIYMVQC